MGVFIEGGERGGRGFAIAALRRDARAAGDASQDRQLALVGASRLV
jgi:hypothetical protein